MLPGKQRAGSDRQLNWGISLFAARSQDKGLFQGFAELASDKSVGLVLLDSSAGFDDLTVMREQLELALAIAGSRLDVIFVDAEPVLEAMRNTQMIAELLGA